MRPGDEELRRAADVLNAGEKVAMLVGQGAKGATDEVIEVADVLGAGVAKALNGRAAVPDDLPFVTGSIGLLGTKPSDDMMEGCDTLLMVGTSFPYSEWLPEPGQARGVQIDIDAGKLGIRYPIEVAMVGDAAETLRALIPLLQRKEDRSWREEIEAGVERWWRLLDERAQVDANPINPQLVFHELSARLPDHAIVLADSGSATNWFARHLRLRRGMDAALSGTLATMCPAVPYALAAKLAFPQPPGHRLPRRRRDADARHQRPDRPRALPGRAGAAPLVVLVLNNGDLNQVTWEQRVLAGDAKLRGDAGPAAVRLRRLRAPARPGGHPGRGARMRSRRRGSARWPPRSPSSSTSSPTPRSRRCRRTSAWSTRRASHARCCTATPAAPTSSASRCARSSRIS